MPETTWDRHPPNGTKARVWHRDDEPPIGTTTQNGKWEYPWFYWLPAPDGGIRQGSIARTWDEAMNDIAEAYMNRWLRAHGLEDLDAR